MKQDDSDLYIMDFSIVCNRCRHITGKRKCHAFSPFGITDESALIPLPIWLGEHDHTEPYPGDGGIQFDAIEEAM